MIHFTERLIHTQILNQRCLYLRSHHSVLLPIGEVKVATNHLLALSEEIGFDAVRKVIRLLQNNTFKPEVVSNYIQDYKTWMSIVQSSVGQSLTNDGFKKIEVPYN